MAVSFRGIVFQTIALVLLVYSVTTAEPKFSVGRIAPGMPMSAVFEGEPRLLREPKQAFVDYSYDITMVYIAPGKELTVFTLNDVVTTVSGQSISIEGSEVLRLGMSFSEAKTAVNPSRVRRRGNQSYFYVDGYTIRLDFEMNSVTRFFLSKESD